ncbi:MAG: phosphatidate cytidylyltransferase [Lentisphaeria bacterium]|nr:phosphatidate cytidylyltransferase [Lentisphaeria bacterium]
MISYREEVKRKLIHLSSLWIPTAMCLLPRWPLCLLFAILLILNLLVERARAKQMPVITPLYDFFFGRMLRQAPAPDAWIISGGPYVFASATMTLALFAPPIAPAAMAVMLLGDTAAALIGRRFGRHKTWNGKSWEGVIAFLAVGYLGAALFLTVCHAGTALYLCAIPGVILAAAVELFEKQLRLDDNFSIPLAVGIALLPAVWL